MQKSRNIQYMRDMQELRRSNAAGLHRSKRHYNRAEMKQELRKLY